MKQTTEGYRRIEPTTLMAPLPVVMVSCRDPESGRANIVTAAWSGIVNTHPPMLSLSLKPERYSYGIIRASGEMVVNLVDRRHARACDFCGVRSGRDVDKFQTLGLETVDVEGCSVAPGIAGMPVHLGCSVEEIRPLGSHDLILAQIRSVSVREDLFDGDGSMHLERAGLICYSHGLYQQVGDVLGFFGYSVARPEAYRKRMQPFQGERDRKASGRGRK